MNEPIDPNRPEKYRSDLEPETSAAPTRRAERSEGTGAIVAVIAVAALIVVGMLYIMQPPSDAPSSMSSEAPPKSAPAPATPAPAPPSETK